MHTAARSADGVLGTIFENILNGNPGANEEAVTEAAKAANIHDFIMTLPNQYRTMYAFGKPPCHFGSEALCCRATHQLVQSRCHGWSLMSLCL